MEKRLRAAWDPDEGNAHGAISEITAAGLLRDIYPNARLNDWNKQGLPDINVPGVFHIEVYAPRESQPERNRVYEELAKPPTTKSRIDVRTVVSHPVTGSGANALRYPANKTALRLLNKKRDTDQGVEGEENVLLVDIQDWDESSRATSFVTQFGPDHHYIGTIGIWHAFYGKAGRPTMLKERTSNRFVSAEQTYLQDPEGLFRIKPQWSAALVVMRDGVVLFENPWAGVTLTEAHQRNLLRMQECRGEYSWFRGRESADELRIRIESELARLEWLFHSNHP